MTSFPWANVVGSCSRIIRKESSPRSILGRSNGGDPPIAATARNCLGSSAAIPALSIPLGSKPATAAAPHPFRHPTVRLAKTPPVGPVSIAMATQIGHLYGFPTVVSALLISHRLRWKRARRKTRACPRAREAIPHRTGKIRPALGTSAWPGCDLSTCRIDNDGNGAVMACAAKTLVWWDRDYDNEGRPIRSDVRSAGRDLWEQACRRTIAAVADPGPAAELMENAVAQVSRYLDRIQAPRSPRKHGLVLVAFCRGLHRYAARLSRVEFVGGSEELPQLPTAERSMARAEAHLELQRIVRNLSSRNAEILMLRASGHDWKQIATLFRTSPACVRNGFWREIERLRCDLG